MDWTTIISTIEDELGLKEQRGELAKILNLNSRIISDIKSGRSKNPGSNIALMLINKLNVNPEWLEKGEEPIFLEKVNNLTSSYARHAPLQVNNLTSTTSQENLPIQESLKSFTLESTAPRFAELEEKIGEKLNNLQAQIDELKGAVEKKQIEEVRESAPTYGIEESSEPEETEDLPLAVNLAAGIPIEAFDSGDIYPVPKKFLKRNKKYCVAKIRGTSMTEAGIADGSYVLLEYTDTALSGEIMVVKYGDQTTLKRLSQKEDGAWELLYEDGSQAKIELKDGDWEVKGHYVRVVGK